jgi:hypothetical protein
MVVQIRDIQKDKSGLRQLVFDLNGDRLYTTRYSHGKGIAFCYIPKIIEGFESGKDRGSFVFDIKEGLFGMKLYPERTPKAVIEECFRIYSAGLKWACSSREYNLTFVDADYFRMVEKFLASGAIKKTKFKVSKYSA